MTLTPEQVVRLVRWAAALEAGHDAAVQPFGGWTQLLPNGTWATLYHARCTCGWRGSVHEAKYVAGLEARAHAEAS